MQEIILTAVAFLVTFIGVWVTEGAWTKRRGAEKAMERAMGKGLGRGRR